MSNDPNSWPAAPGDEPANRRPRLEHNNAQPYAPPPSGQGPYDRDWPGDGRGSSGAPKRSPRSAAKKPLKIAAGVTALLLLTLVSCGTGMAIGADPDAAPQPTATETVEVPGPERVTETEVEVPVTPDACLEYVELSEQAFTLAGEAMNIMQGALNAAAQLDVAGIESAGAQLDILNAGLDTLTDPMLSAKAECQAS